MDSYLEMFFPWLLRASWQAAVLVLIVLVVQWLCRKRLSARWLHALWLVVLIRLALPFSPESAVSVFNLTQWRNVEETVAVPESPKIHPAAEAFPDASSVSDFGLMESEEVEDVDSFYEYDRRDWNPAGLERVDRVVEAEVTQLEWLSLKRLPWLFGMLWVAGVFVLTVRIIWQSVRFAARLRRAGPVTDVELVRLFDDCKRLFGLSRNVRLVETDAVKSPAVCGIVRPKVLLPRSMVTAFSREELRYVFLHELGHVKRWDLLVHWLASCLHVLHWFNPLIGYGFRRMAADRELACDEFALSHAREEDRIFYGSTIIKLLEHLPRSTALPGVVGILEDKHQMRRRISRIAKFRKRRRWSSLAVCVIGVLAIAGLTDARTAESEVEGVTATEVAAVGTGREVIVRKDVAGIVRDEAGQALEGATAYIYTAAPKVGPAKLCPTCYADCGKQDRADAAGRFIVEDLDSSLLFQIFVTAAGYQPEFVSDVDPGGEPLDVVLKPVTAASTAEHRIRGRVVDAEDKPVSGAVVAVQSITRGESTGFDNQGIDPVAVTDDAGQFQINAREAFAAAGLRVEAVGLATRVFDRLDSGDAVHELTMTEGVSVSGRVMDDGKPVAGSEIGIATADRNARFYVGEFEVATDDEGYFLFTNLQPETFYQVYGSMGSFPDHGVVKYRNVKTGEDGSTLKLDDLVVEAGYEVSGVVKLKSGEAPPVGIVVWLGRENARDSVKTWTDHQGRFAFSGVPAEQVTLSVRLEKYTYSLRNRSLDPLNSFRLIGRIFGDKTDLLIELEQGERHRDLQGDEMRVRNQPLRGAEEQVAGPADLTVSGTVRDAATGEALEEFTVTEGYEYYRGGHMWPETGRTVHRGGTFSVIVPNSPDGAILIAAEGYQPQYFPVDRAGEKLLDVQLERGGEISGTLLLSNGNPAVGVTVYLADISHSLYNSDGFSVRDREEALSSTVTDESGRFSFAPSLEAYGIVVVDEAGYAERTVEALWTDPEVRLQEWAGVEGRLMIGGEPGSNETVRLNAIARPYDYYPRHSSPLSLYRDATTDEEGNFSFQYIPPMPVEVSHSPVVRDSPYGTIPKSQTVRIELEPGERETVVLGGKGRPVIGRVVVTGYEGEIDWRQDVHSLTLITEVPDGLVDLDEVQKQFLDEMQGVRTPAERDVARSNYQRRREEALRKNALFYQTDVGRRYRLSHRQYALEFSQDGSFRIEDVPAGRYKLEVALQEPSREISPNRSETSTIGTVTMEVEVPPSLGGRSDDPLDLGDIELMRSESER